MCFEAQEGLDDVKGNGKVTAFLLFSKACGVFSKQEWALLAIGYLIFLHWTLTPFAMQRPRRHKDKKHPKREIRSHQCYPNRAAPPSDTATRSRPPPFQHPSLTLSSTPGPRSAVR